MFTDGYSIGDTFTIFHKGEKIAIVKLLKINKYSLEFEDDLGDTGKITFVTPHDKRLYLNTAPNRQIVLRGIEIKVGGYERY